jgi:hypothetical protein
MVMNWRNGIKGAWTKSMKTPDILAALTPVIEAFGQLLIPLNSGFFVCYKKPSASVVFT